MKPHYEVRIISFDILEELEAAWADDDYLALLEQMEFEGAATIAAAELRDMCLLALQDLKPSAAAASILKYKLGSRLSVGEISNMSNEMLDEKLWEEHADMTLHESLFNIGSLLYCAFPATFPEPDAVRVKLSVSAANESAQAVLSQVLMESFLVRLLGDGMQEDAVLHRIFKEQLVGTSFPEADKIVWIVSSKPISDHKLEIEVVSSGYWLDSLRDTRAYESSAYADRPEGVTQQ